MNDEKFGYSGAAEFTGIKKATIYSMVSRKQIPHFRVSGRLVIFSRDELAKWLEARRVPVGEPGEQIY